VKRIIMLTLVAAMLLPACGGGAPEAAPTTPPTAAPTEAAQPADTPVPGATATPAPEEASPTPEATATAAVEQPSPTAEPTPAPEPTATTVTGPVVLFQDDFNGSLATGWSWVREDPTHWNLTDSPGSLRITLQDGFIVLSSVKNLLLRSAPSGNFEIATFVNCTPTSNFQLAGLVVYQDDSNYLQFGRSFCDRAETCVGNGVYFDNVVAREGGGSKYATTPGSQSEAYLRLRREGTTYTAYFSEDGANWTVIGQHSNPLNPLRVGLIAAQATQDETTADFDYFTITTLP
jgi:beta-xylosidase